MMLLPTDETADSLARKVPVCAETNAFPSENTIGRAFL